MIHTKITFYGCFGRVSIVKNINYRILECTRIVHVFWNVEFLNKHFEKPRIYAIYASIIRNQYLITFLTNFF